MKQTRIDTINEMCRLAEKLADFGYDKAIFDSIIETANEWNKNHDSMEEIFIFDLDSEYLADEFDSDETFEGIAIEDMTYFWKV